MDKKAQDAHEKDLERRILAYEEMEKNNQWPGALTSRDYTAITLLTLGLVLFFGFWGY